MNHIEEWKKVFKISELGSIVKSFNNIKNYTPEKEDIFKAFKLTSYDNLKVVIIGQDPYPQKGIATGLAFGNKKDTKILSPSLEVIKSSIFRAYRKDDNRFDITLESWAKQGILLLNSSLTTEINKVGTHVNLWIGFISSLIKNLSEINSGIIYVLLGNQAKLLKPYINKNSNYIIEDMHPAYYARNNIPMNEEIWIDINKIIKMNYKQEINFYEEIIL